MKIRYRVQRCRNKTGEPKLFGPVHGMGEQWLFGTLCGLDASGGHWFVLSNDFDGPDITCKKCLKVE